MYSMERKVYSASDGGVALTEQPHFKKKERGW